VSSAKAEAKKFFDSGMTAFARADLPVATEAFQNCADLDPQNADAWCYLGMAALPRDFARAKAALDRALVLTPEHHGALYWRAEADWVDGNPRSAASFLQRINDIAPGAPQNLARQAFAHLDAGEKDTADELLRQAVALGKGLASVETFHPELRRAIYLDLLGRHEEASSLVQSVNGEGVSPDLPSTHYPNDLEAQRCALENVVAGRDIIILGSGPSLEELPPLLRSLGKSGCERLCFFGFNNVPVAERMLQDCIGRGVDLACMTSVGVMELHLDWIRDFLARAPKSNLFLMPSISFPPNSALETVLNSCPEKLFYFTATADYPPIPEDPLHFPPINTLMCVLPLAVLAQPRRIFLFGCDGVVSQNRQTDSPVYFRQGSADYGKQAAPAASAYANWLARDTFFFNLLIPTVLNAFSVLHRTSVPPILNCNTDSAYRPFPRISTMEFLQKQSETPLTEHIFPARISQLQRQLERLHDNALARSPAQRLRRKIRQLKQKVGWLHHQAGRIKRFLMTRVRTVWRRLSAKRQ
jgi:hypothetical protein